MLVAAILQTVSAVKLPATFCTLVERPKKENIQINVHLYIKIDAQRRSYPNGTKIGTCDAHVLKMIRRQYYRN